MAEDSNKQQWTGSTGRCYAPIADEPTRAGERATVHAVSSADAPTGRSFASAGTRLALKIHVAGDDSAWRLSSQTLLELSHTIATPPCPRIYDQIEDGAGLVMEWCPLNLESWWAGVMDAPEGFRALCQSLSEVCRRTTEYRAFARDREDAAPIVLQNATVLRRGDGRWLLSQFGAPPRVSADDTETQVIAEPDNFTSPEVLFDSASILQPASECWSLGCMLFSLLQMRVYSRDGVPLPDTGTSGQHFRSHRTNLVIDLYQRKPGLFTGRALDPREFLYPDHLPEPDRKLVERSVESIFGTAQPELEAQLSRRLLQILDKALSIDPAARHADPMALGHELEQLGRWYRETHQGISASQAAKSPVVETRVLKGPMRSKTDEALDELQSTIKDHGEMLQSIRSQQESLSQQLQAASQGRRGLWGAVALLSLLLGAQYVQQLASDPTAAPSSTPVAVDPSPVAPAEALAAQPPEAQPEEEVDSAEPGSSEAMLSEEPTLAAPAQVRSSPAPAAPEPSPAEAITKGSINVSGAIAWLVGPDGRVNPGTLDDGSYEVFVTMNGDAPLSLGTVELNAGEAIQFNCGFGTCKRIQ